MASSGLGSPIRESGPASGFFRAMTRLFNRNSTSSQLAKTTTFAGDGCGNQ